MDAFRRKLSEACDIGVQSGKITRIQKFRIMATTIFPRQRKALEQHITLEFALDEDAAASGLIDWENFDVEKFVEILEAIMMFIEFLSKFS